MAVPHFAQPSFLYEVKGHAGLFSYGTGLESTYVHTNLVPRPPPTLYLAAVEKSLAPAFLHGCEIKCGCPGFSPRLRDKVWVEAGYEVTYTRGAVPVRLCILLSLLGPSVRALL